uniref:F-box domain-containing protein n=1 Tax=Caenorhabditis tropicalis TaxID=1561998 RepID=A0A1I7UTK5_9PELO
MDLLRLPLLVLVDVFKNMDFREKFLISLISKRAKNMLKVTSAKFDFSFIFSFCFHINWEHSRWSSFNTGTSIARDYCIKGEVMKLSFHSHGLILQETSFRKRLLLVVYLLDTFGNPTLSVEFQNSTQPESVLEFMRMINQRKKFIKSFKYHLTENSFEHIPTILDECTEVTDSIMIETLFPDDFVYTPPRPFKAEQLFIRGRSNWVNLESFMNCRYISVHLSSGSTNTAQDWSSFLIKWIGSNTRLQQMSISGFQSLAFIMIVDIECLLFIPIITLENLAAVHSYNKGDDATCASTTDWGPTEVTSTKLPLSKETETREINY